MALRAAAYWRTISQQSGRSFSTAAKPAEPKPRFTLKAEQAPLLMIGAFVVIAGTLGGLNLWQLGAHNPNVTLNKSKRGSIHEIDHASIAGNNGGKLIDKSFLRKIAHIQAPSTITGSSNTKDSIYTRSRAVETVESDK